MGGLCRPLSREAWGQTARQDGPGARRPLGPGSPAAAWHSVGSSAALGTASLRPWTQKRVGTRAAVAGPSGFERNTDSAPGWEGPTWARGSDDG